LTYSSHPPQSRSIGNEAAPVTVVVPASWRSRASVEQRVVTADEASVQRRFSDKIAARHRRNVPSQTHDLR
jgi:hypothetical protein